MLNLPILKHDDSFRLVLDLPFLKHDDSFRLVLDLPFLKQDDSFRLVLDLPFLTHLIIKTLARRLIRLKIEHNLISRILDNKHTVY